MVDEEDIYLNGVIRSRLTRNISPTFDQVNDEFTEALGACIPATSEGM